MCIIFQFPLGRHHLLCYNYLSLELIHSVELVYLLFLLVADQSWLTIQKIYFLQFPYSISLEIEILIELLYEVSYLLH